MERALEGLPHVGVHQERLDLHDQAAAVGGEERAGRHQCEIGADRAHVSPFFDAPEDIGVGGVGFENDGRPFHQVAVHQHVDLVLLEGRFRGREPFRRRTRLFLVARDEEVEVLDDVRLQGGEVVKHVRPTPEILAQGAEALVDEFQGRIVHQPLDVGVELLVEFFDRVAGPLDLRLDLADVFIDLRLLVGGELRIVVGGKNLAVDDRHYRVVLL